MIISVNSITSIELKKKTAYLGNIVFLPIHHDVAIGLIGNAFVGKENPSVCVLFHVVKNRGDII